MYNKHAGVLIIRRPVKLIMIGNYFKDMQNHDIPSDNLKEE